MTKRWRIVLAVALLVVVGAVLVGATRKAPRFGDGLALLRSLPSAHAEVRNMEGMWVHGLAARGSGTPIGGLKLIKEFYRIREPFPSFNERAKKELKPISHEAFAYPTKNPEVTTYNTKSPQTGMPVTVYVQDDGKGGTMVITEELAETTWVDNAKEWLRKLFRR